MTQNYYELLGLDINAKIEDIKKAYRQLSFKYHPDRNNEPDAKEKFQTILQAYEVLNDPQKKQQYDFSLQRNNMSHNFDFGNIRINEHHINLNDFINSFRNMGRQGFNMSSNIFTEMMQKPAPIKKHIDITLEQAYNGCVIPLTIERFIIQENERKTETETIYIEIPKGIDNNEIITYRNKGNVLNNITGEIRIHINILKHELFERKGLDLIYKLDISLKNALCGLSIDMKHLNNKIFRITNNPGAIVKQNEKKYINNLGMIRDKHIGTLIIEFNIIFPETLTEEQISKLNEIL